MRETERTLRGMHQWVHPEVQALTERPLHMRTLFSSYSNLQKKKRKKNALLIIKNKIIRIGTTNHTCS